MSVTCICNHVSSGAVDRAINREVQNLSAAPDISEATSIVYCSARDAEAQAGMVKPVSCTKCFETVADRIKEVTSRFGGQSLPDIKTEDGKQRRQQLCRRPQFVMED